MIFKGWLLIKIKDTSAQVLMLSFIILSHFTLFIKIHHGSSIRLLDINGFFWEWGFVVQIKDTSWKFLLITKFLRLFTCLVGYWLWSCFQQILKNLMLKLFWCRFFLVFQEHIHNRSIILNRIILNRFLFDLWLIIKIEDASAKPIWNVRLIHGIDLILFV